MVTHRAHRHRSTLAVLALAPLLAAAACGSAAGPRDVNASAIDDAPATSGTRAGTSLPPVASPTALDPARLRAVQTGLDTVNGDTVFLDATAGLRDADDRLRATGTLAPPTAQRLNDLRTARPKNCTEIRTVAGKADTVLSDGRAALGATSSNAQVVADSVARLRKALDQARSDIAALQGTASYATSDSRQQLETYSTAVEAADVNLSGGLTTVTEARARVQRLTTTFTRLSNARDKALKGC